MALKDQTDDLLSKENVKDAAMFGAEFIPGVGEALAIKRTSDALDKKDYLGAGIEAAAGLLGVIPVVGDVAGKSLRVATKKFRRQDIEEAAPSWFKETKVSKNIKPEDAQKTQITTTTATYEKAKNILPEGNTLDFGAGKGVGAKKVGSDTYEPFADKSFSPTYTDAKAIPSNSYNNVTSLNVLNVVKPETRSEIVQDIGRILKPGGTGIITTRGMDVFGNSKNPVRGILADEPRAVITSSGTYQKGFTQKELREYIADELGESFTVSDVSGLGKAGVKVKKKSNNLDMAEGGAVPMKEQMEMFQDGGLEQDGGTTDPVSGNDVPFGSAQKEVRDDIPAQLSEGEFVFPADVVRFIGLEKLMRMRQEAKMGLKMMEEMGQMGNSEEATIPDDLPFGMTDLVMVDSDDKKEYNVGGVVNQPSNVQSGQTQIGMASTPMSMPEITRPTQQDVPVYEAPDPLPTYEQYMAPPAQPVPETIEYINPATGERRTFTFINGKPTIAIPEGFIPVSEYTPEQVTTQPTVGTTSVREDTSDDDERRRKEEEEKYGPGGGRFGIAGEIYGVSFDMPEGFMPGVMGTAGTALGLLSGKPLPEDVTVKFKKGDDVFALTGTEYNTLKQSIADNGANSKATQTTLEELRDGARSRQVVKNAAKMAEEAKKALETGDADDGSIKLNEYDMAGNVVGTAVVTSKVASEIASGQDIEGVAYDYSGFPEAGDPKDFTPTETDDFYEEYDDDFQQGGLASKKKPKVKKMKRGGLASKK